MGKYSNEASNYSIKKENIKGDLDKVLKKLIEINVLLEGDGLSKDALTVNSMKENSEIMDYIVKLKSSLDSCSSQLMLKAKSLDVELERIKAKQLELMSGKIDIEGDL